jgi:hypothetical protein
MLNFIFGRQSGCQELKQLVQHLTTANEKMSARARSAQKVGDTLHALMQSEAPSYALFFEPIKEIYTKLSLNYETAAQEQARAVEDLRDIVIRFPIFERIASDRETAKKSYDLAQKKYKDAKTRAQNQTSPEILTVYRTAKIERANAAAVLVEKAECYLSYRSRFARFVQNRSKTGWMRFGSSIERASRVESELMGKLAGLCRRVRDNVENPQAILQVAESIQIEKDEKTDFFIVDESEVKPAQEPVPVTKVPEDPVIDDWDDDIVLAPPILNEAKGPTPGVFVDEADDLSEGLLGPDD